MPDYIYMTPEEFAEHTKQSLEAIKPITVPDTMTVQDLIDLKDVTNGRFSYSIDDSGRLARAVWVNYYQTASGSYRLDAKTGAASLNKHLKKEIDIQEA